MPSSAQRSVRPYLSARERRQHLLDSAGQIVRDRGWSAVSMQGVAAAAGVSRQLVYEHFAAVDELHCALLVHLFEPAYDATRAVVSSGTSVRAVLRGAYELFLDMPPEQRRAIRALASADEPGQSELARAKRMLRRRIAGLWVPYVSRETARDESDAKALAWMLIMSAWGLSDMVADRTIGRARAVALFVRFAEQAIVTSRSTQEVSP